MHNLWFFSNFFQKSLFAENYFLIAAIDLTTQVQLYTCLVLKCMILITYLNILPWFYPIRSTVRTLVCLLNHLPVSPYLDISAIAH